MKSQFCSTRMLFDGTEKSSSYKYKNRTQGISKPDDDTDGRKDETVVAVVTHPSWNIWYRNKGLNINHT